MAIQIHPTAEISDEAEIGEGTSIWHQSQIREYAKLGENCVISKGVYIDFKVQIGNNVKIQNYVSVYHGVTIEDGVFVGPHVCFTNDLKPRAINSDDSLKAPDDWTLSKILIKKGAALGANSTIICGLTIGEWAMIGAGSVVTKDVPDHGLVFGNPARLRGFVCACGERLEKQEQAGAIVKTQCSSCNETILINLKDWEKLND